ncbi:MAG: SDR family oxidoreductase [Bacteroidia bacterium]|nr:SDR family oxidoreductase [Bacteroidia bacterium]
MKITGNTILITGGTSGIGLGFARAFHKLGNTVIICGRREDRLAKIAAEFPGMINRKCDISCSDERRNLATWVISEYPALNILFNNAGVQFDLDMFHEVNHDRLCQEISTNFTAPVHLTSLFSGHLCKMENSAIINISSGLAFVPMAFMPVYCATKAALHSFTLSMRYQFRKTSLRIFEIAPPAVATELGHDHRADGTSPHYGISVDEFLVEAMEAIKNDVYEAMVDNARNLRNKNEQMFNMLNPA